MSVDDFSHCRSILAKIFNAFSKLSPNDATLHTSSGNRQKLLSSLLSSLKNGDFRQKKEFLYLFSVLVEILQKLIKASSNSIFPFELQTADACFMAEFTVEVSSAAHYSLLLEEIFEILFLHFSSQDSLQLLSLYKLPLEHAFIYAICQLPVNILIGSSFLNLFFACTSSCYIQKLMIKRMKAEIHNSKKITEVHVCDAFFNKTLFSQKNAQNFAILFQKELLCDNVSNLCYAKSNINSDSCIATANMNIAEMLMSMRDFVIDIENCKEFDAIDAEKIHLLSIKNVLRYKIYKGTLNSFSFCVEDVEVLDWLLKFPNRRSMQLEEFWDEISHRKDAIELLRKYYRLFVDSEYISNEQLQNRNFILLGEYLRASILSQKYSIEAFNLVSELILRYSANEDENLNKFADFSVVLLIILLEGCECSLKVTSCLCFHFIKSLPSSTLLYLLFQYSSTLYKYIFENFCRSESLFAKLCGLFKCTVGEFIDQGVLYIFPSMFFSNANDLQLLYSLKGFDAATFMATHIHHLLSYCFLEFSSEVAFQNQMNLLLSFSSNLSGKPVELHELFKACFQDVLKVILVEINKSPGKYSAKQTRAYLQKIAELVLQERSDSESCIAVLIKRSFLSVFYGLTDELTRSTHDHEKLAIFGALFDLVSRIDVNDLKTFSSHVMPLVQQYAQEEDPKIYFPVLSKILSVFVAVSSEKNTTEYLIFLKHLDAEHFSKIAHRFSHVKSAQILLFEDFSKISAEEFLCIVTEALLSNFTLISKLAVDVLKNSILKMQEYFNSSIIEFPILNNFQRAIYQLLALEQSTDIRNVLLGILAKIPYIEGSNYNLNNSKISQNQTQLVFYVEYVENLESMQDYGCDLLENYLIPAFRSCSDCNLQDKLAFICQELLKICGFSKFAIAGKQMPIEESCQNKFELQACQKWKKFPLITRENLSPFLKTKYCMSISTLTDFSEMQFGKLNIKYSQWIVRFYSLCLSKFSKDFHKSFFTPFRSIITSESTISKHIICSIVLCLLLDEDPDYASVVPVELNCVFENFASPGQSPKEIQKIVAFVFSLLDLVKMWMKKISAEAKNKPKSQSVNLLFWIKKLQTSFISKLNFRGAAKCAFFYKDYERALQFLEECLPCNDEFYVENYEMLRDIYLKLHMKTDLKELIKKFHTGTHDLCLMYDIEQDYRNCLLVSQSLQNAFYTEKSLYMLGLDTVLVQFYFSLPSTHSTKTVSDFANRSVVNLARWDLIDLTAKETKEIPLLIKIASECKKEDSKMTDFCHFAPEILSEKSSVYVKLLEDLSQNNHLINRRQFIDNFELYDLVFCIHQLGFPSSKIWLERAKKARKNELYDLALSSLLHTSQASDSEAVSLEKAKIFWNQGKKLHALYILKDLIEPPILFENSLRVTAVPSTQETSDINVIKSKILRLSAKWMDELQMDKSGEVLSKLNDAVKLDESSEKSFVLLAKYQYKLYMYEAEKLKQSEDTYAFSSVLNAAYASFRTFGKALATGVKYVYESMPKFINIWLDVSQQYHTKFKSSSSPALLEVINKFDKTVERYLTILPAYQFFVSLNLLLARLNHPSESSAEVIIQILITLLSNYRDQTLWFLFSQSKSSNVQRKNRFNSLMTKLKCSEKSEIIADVSKALGFFDCLLQIANHNPPEKTTMFSLSSIKDLSVIISKLMPMDWIIPIIETLVPSLPSSSNRMEFRPFEFGRCPRIAGIKNDVELLPSLVKPKKVTLLSNDGREFIFLCKPKDDLRTDSRVMDFLTLVNKLFSRSKYSKRHADLFQNVRCYCVLALNEECGIIEWVNDTIPFRSILTSMYAAKGIQILHRDEITKILDSKSNTKEAFIERLLPKFPPVFGSWFVYQFTDPASWFQSKKSFTRSLASMSMIGAMLGLGDRHGENILLNEKTGEVMHVDFNCLFEKGLRFAKPEKVPFRLTQNLEHALGLMGKKGILFILYANYL